MQTTLTVAGAAEILEELARAGHLEARTSGGSIVYALMQRDRTELGRPQADLEAPPSRPPEEPQEEALVEPLSERELEVLRLLASGRTNREISQDLFVAVGTVKAHVNNVYRKLGARNRADAASKARSLGLLNRGTSP